MRKLGTRAVRFWLALASVSLALAHPALAEEQDNKALARQHFQRGVELANANNYDESLREFSRAYELSPHYSVLYNIGQAHVALGHAAQSVEALKRYLAEGGANIALERRQAVEADVIRQLAATGTLDVRVDVAEAGVAIDGAPRGRSPLAEPFRLDVGAHRVEVSLTSGEHQEQTISVAAGQNQVADFRLRAEPARPSALGAPRLEARAPPPAPPAPPSSTSGGDRSTVGLVLGSVGVGLGGAALAHFLWNRGRYHDWQSKYSRYFELPTSENRRDANELAESIQRASAVTLGLTIGAGLALGGGTLVVLVDGSKNRTTGSTLSFRGAW
jgi:tetratricopeptide (TPR) repeat protein